MATATSNTRRALLKGAFALPAIAAAPALASDKDEAVIAYRRARAASDAYNAESERIGRTYEADNDAYDRALDALDASATGREHTEAWEAALDARATTIPGIEAKARIVANAQGVSLTTKSPEGPDRVFITLIEDIARLTNTPVGV